MTAQQAVVIGGSIAGLATARALSEYFDRVILIERDEEPKTMLPRKAVPQGYHAHALLKSGEMALEKLFPGFCDEVLDCGGKRIDFSKDIRWFHGGAWRLRYESDFEVMIQTRPMLEQIMRQRVRAIKNVEFYYAHEVEAVKLNADKTRVVGLVIQDMASRSKKVELTADLLVDASGRGSKTPQWLKDAGYNTPEETQLRLDLSYSSRIYKAPEEANYDWKLLLTNPYVPDSLRAGYVFPVENNQWLVTLAGYSGDTTPKNSESFIEYAKGLAVPDLHEVMQDLEPLTEVKYASFPHTSRRHYENCKMPEAWLVMGDAFCSFDPVFGQGMSVAALEASALREMLAKDANLKTIGKRFHKKAAEIVEVPWSLTCSEDFRYPGTVGKKSALIPFLHWYSGHIFKLAATDKEVFLTFLKVMHLLAGLETLFKPGIIVKVLKNAFAS